MLTQSLWIYQPTPRNCGTLNLYGEFLITEDSFRTGSSSQNCILSRVVNCIYVTDSVTQNFSWILIEPRGWWTGRWIWSRRICSRGLAYPERNMQPQTRFSFADRYYRHHLRSKHRTNQNFRHPNSTVKLISIRSKRLSRQFQCPFWVSPCGTAGTTFLYLIISGNFRTPCYKDHCRLAPRLSNSDSCR